MIAEKVMFYSKPNSWLFLILITLLSFLACKKMYKKFEPKEELQNSVTLENAVEITVRHKQLKTSIETKDVKTPTISERMKEILRKEKVLNETAKTMQGLDQNDAKLIQYTRDTILIPPETASKNDSTTGPLIFEEKDDPSVEHVALKVINLLKQRKNGFIVECGVWNGMAQSNSVVLENFHNWTSLLIEAAPTSLKTIKTMRKRAWIAPACLSTKPYSNMVKFLDQSATGQIVGPSTNITDKSIVNDVLCIPFMTFMQALNKTFVDYFSLDVEGNEMEILPLIDFEKIKIDVMTIEHQFHHGKLGEMIEIMARNNFTLHSVTSIDLIFVNNRLKI
ncbi:uncharacterized protein LOC132192973 [Neocloeon triangulifer]|uniref:uncharacterized protein LOC132192973 n=1 Tax=Neocloeon triangulifer TaxID=2078957 RepID=UPI00286EF85C|nr:uncharacterized protein LOC132192973 [Neocloeon triangulifer]